MLSLGDFIARGPQSRETLALVRGMINHRAARSVLGNPESNAICYHTPDGSGNDFLTSRSSPHVAATRLEQAANRSD